MSTKSERRAARLLTVLLVSPLETEPTVSDPGVHIAMGCTGREINLSPLGTAREPRSFAREFSLSLRVSARESQYCTHIFKTEGRDPIEPNQMTQC